MSNTSFSILFSLKPKDFNNLNHYRVFNRLMKFIKNKKVVSTKSTQNYFIVITRENHLMNYYVIGVDKTTDKYFVNKVIRDDIININDDKDIFRLLDYDYDCDLENVETIYVDGRYRVQGDLVLNVRTDYDYVQRLIHAIEAHLNSTLDNIILSRLQNLIVSEMNLSAHRFLNEIEIQLNDILLHKYTKGQILETLINKLYELTNEYQELLFSDIIMFLSNNKNDSINLTINKTYNEIIIENNYMRVIVYVHVEGKFLVEIKLSTYYNYENIINNVLKSLEYRKFETNYGRHRILFESAIPNHLQVKIKLNLREIDQVIVDIRTGEAIIAKNRIIIMHPEHGVKEILINGIMTVSINSVRNDLEREMNSYTLLSLFKKSNT